MRVSAVQYCFSGVDSFEGFAQKVKHYVQAGLEFNPDVILFPEYITNELAPLAGKEGVRGVYRFTEQYLALFSELSARHNTHIVGGTHITEEGGRLYNISYLFFPDRTVARQVKLHLTPTEKGEWGISAGDTLEVFELSKGRIAILICYDAEFPEVARRARALGADVFFCPSCTDDSHGYYRVRYTCHARAVENQVYVVLTGTVGSLPVDSMRNNYGQAVIITPSDMPFPPGGILAKGIKNSDMAVVADLNMKSLYYAREYGSVKTWQDRRTDLYSGWSKGD